MEIIAVLSFMEIVAVLSFHAWFIENTEMENASSVRLIYLGNCHF